MFFRKAFTLIELLIVIGIVGVISGTVLVVVNPTKQRDKANDAVMLATMEKLSLALEASYGSTFSYPSSCAELASVSSSNVVCSSANLFTVNGVALPQTCTSQTQYANGGSTACKFYYYTSGARKGCIFVNSNNTQGGRYLVARYGRVIAASNYTTNGCDAISR